MAHYPIDDTIAAIATAMGEGSICVLRLSGDAAKKITARIFQSKSKTLPETFQSQRIYRGGIFDQQGDLVDDVLVSYFQKPNSYTGEDVIEISAHGGTANAKRILDLLIFSGARHALPGEFTRRAFLNGKIDLTQAEAVLDLISAKSKRSLDAAARQLAGNLSLKIKNYKNELMRLYAHLEAAIDFPEDELEVYDDFEISQKITELRQSVERFIQSFNRGSLMREGVRVVIAGKPNVGKSSLFNALLERDRALVSAIPGTTRDHLEESIEIDGFQMRLIDTAGITDGLLDPIDRMSIERSKGLLSENGLFLFVLDGSQSLEDADRTIYQSLAGKFVVVLINKSDLPVKLSEKDLESLRLHGNPIKISTKEGSGLSELENRIIEMLKNQGIPDTEEQVTRLRHRHSFEKASECLTRAEKAFQDRESIELIAFELKAAVDELRELIGEVYSEDLLDVIFSEFCIGK